MRFALLTALAVALAPLPSDAAPFRLLYSGTVQTVSDPDGALAAGGVAVAATDPFDVDVVGTPGGGWNGTATVAGTIFHQSFTDVLVDGGSVGDELILGSSVPFELGNGITVDFFSLRLQDLDGSALVSSAFPTELRIADWSVASLLIGGYLFELSADPDPRFQIIGTIQSVSLTEIPEPPNAALLALGLCVLAYAGRPR